MAKRKPGKYDHLLPKLPKLPPEDLEYQQRVEDVKKRLRVCPRCEGRKVELMECNFCDGRSECSACNGTRKLDIAGSICHVCAGSGRRPMTGQTLGALYVAARADVATVAKVMSDANLELEALSQLLIAAQENNDPDFGAFGASDRALKLTNGDSIRTQPEIYPVAKDKAAFREWCFANGLRNKMELPVKPMTDLAKTRLLNGDSEPTGMTIYVRTKIVYTPLKTEVSTTNSDEVTEDVF